MLGNDQKKKTLIDELMIPKMAVQAAFIVPSSSSSASTSINGNPPPLLQDFHKRCEEVFQNVFLRWCQVLPIIPGTCASDGSNDTKTQQQQQQQEEEEGEQSRVQQQPVIIKASSPSSSSSSMPATTSKSPVGLFPSGNQPPPPPPPLLPALPAVGPNVLAEMQHNLNMFTLLFNRQAIEMPNLCAQLHAGALDVVGAAASAPPTVTTSSPSTAHAVTDDGGGGTGGTTNYQCSSFSSSSKSATPPRLRRALDASALFVRQAALISTACRIIVTMLQKVDCVEAARLCRCCCDGCLPDNEPTRQNGGAALSSSPLLSSTTSSNTNKGGYNYRGGAASPSVSPPAALNDSPYTHSDDAGSTNNGPTGVTTTCSLKLVFASLLRLAISSTRSLALFRGQHHQNDAAAGKQQHGRGSSPSSSNHHAVLEIVLRHVGTTGFACRMTLKALLAVFGDFFFDSCLLLSSGGGGGGGAPPLVPSSSSPHHDALRPTTRQAEGDDKKEVKENKVHDTVEGQQPESHTDFLPPAEEGDDHAAKHFTISPAAQQQHINESKPPSPLTSSSASSYPSRTTPASSPNNKSSGSRSSSRSSSGVNCCGTSQIFDAFEVILTEALERFCDGDEKYQQPQHHQSAVGGTLYYNDNPNHDVHLLIECFDVMCRAEGGGGGSDSGNGSATIGGSDDEEEGRRGTGGAHFKHTAEQLVPFIAAEGNIGRTAVLIDFALRAQKVLQPLAFMPSSFKNNSIIDDNKNNNKRSSVAGSRSSGHGIETVVATTDDQNTGGRRSGGGRERLYTRQEVIAELEEGKRIHHKTEKLLRRTLQEAIDRNKTLQLRLRELLQQRS